GGSSRVKEEGSPFRMVLESSLEITRVITTPNTITPVSISAEMMLWNGPASMPAKNMVMIAMRVGNLPLQGTKLLVMVATSRSLGESMIRQPITPAALHPNPMHIV